MSLHKAIVIGLDGFDLRIARTLLERGKLPNLDRIRHAGGLSPLATTTPAQTPVAWSSFATGTNPGGHGIFDFLRRDPDTHLPDVALFRYDEAGRFRPPRAVNLRGGIPVWEVLSSAGISSTVLRCPCTYPPGRLRGRMLAGVGVPDLRGGFGTSTLFTERDGVRPDEAERIVRIRPDPGGSIETDITGPRSPAQGSDASATVFFEVTSEGARAIASGRRGRRVDLTEGRWSDWLKLKFRLGRWQSVRGAVRFFPLRLTSPLEIYASPVNFDASAPMFPISTPWGYAAELERVIGTYHTLGMAEDHNGLNAGRIDETAFLEQCETVLREREGMMLEGLERQKDGLFFCLFDTPDRVQHMFWRFREPGHPANAKHEDGADHAGVIEEHYRRCDAVVGRAMEFADERTLTVVLSDHGFASYQRQLHLNRWLYEHGFLALSEGSDPTEAALGFFRNVDWSRTRAYAVGLAGIYINRSRRERKGCVASDEAGALEVEIARALSGLIDPQRGEVAVRSVLRSRDIYSGPYLADAPDLLVNCAPGYRVSSATAMGGTPETAFEDNTRRWSGDHVVDPASVPGVLFMNRPFRQRADIRDLAPTILDALGVAVPPHMEGTSLL